VCRYVADEELRRRHLDDQIDQALCLTLVTNAVVLWTTTYLGHALDALRADGYPLTDEAAAHLTLPSTTTSTSTAPTPSTSTPNYAVKDTTHSASRREPGADTKITKTTRLRRFSE